MFRRWIDEPESSQWEKEFHDNSVVNVRQWMETLAIMMIPIVNIVMIIWWAMSSKELIPANKVNWARASIIIFSFTLVASVIVVGLLFLNMRVY